MSDTGLSEEILDGLKTALEETPHLEKAAFFGSRARGDHKPQSDIDIAIFGANIMEKDLAALHMRLEGLPILYKIDLVHYDSLKDEKLKKLIDRDRKTILEK
jgi:predicted nucleotidyltransferase